MISAEHIDELSAAAKRHYGTALPYHNWTHAEAVMAHVDVLSKRVQKRKLAVARGALHIAAAWHDAGFHRDHAELGFKTKEHYSVSLAEEYLAEHRIDKRTRGIVKTAILGTIHGAERSDINALILHRADIANVGGNYPGFLSSNIKLWHEARLFSPALTWDDWKRSSTSFAEFSAREARDELPRIGEPVSVRGAYDLNAGHNAERLLSEPEPSNT